MGGIYVDYCGDRWPVAQGEEFTFGRGTTVDLHIDDNPQLHRQFGHIWYHDGDWWLHNVGSRLLLHIYDRQSRSTASVAPGLGLPLVFAQSALRFTAGAATYEVLVDLENAPDTRPDRDFDESTVSESTIDQSSIPLTASQRLLLVALAEPALRNRGRTAEIPANKSIAARFGWSTTTFNRALDRLCRKLDKAGVAGLVGAPGEQALDRRRRLVEHAVSTGLVSEVDLALLDSAGEPTDE